MRRRRLRVSLHAPASQRFLRKRCSQDGSSGLVRHSAIPASSPMLSIGDAQLPGLAAFAGLLASSCLLYKPSLCWGGHIQEGELSVQSLLPALLKTPCCIARSPAGFVFVLVMRLLVELEISAGIR